MIEAHSTSHNRKWTCLLLAVCGVLAIAAVVTGIDDNPSGIILMYLSAGAFILAIRAPLEKLETIPKLIYASILGFIASAILHNVFEFFASESGSAGLILGVLGGAFFLIAVLLCPVGLLVGVVGAVIMSRRERHSQAGVEDG